MLVAVGCGPLVSNTDELVVLVGTGEIVYA